ncbi:MAG: betaine/proline/choline family ABC transporter ATP-binding protein [Spirochaetia bacterium]|jgi:osmoprotectant transport system ATP-binding protein|nr:betaine/proline/choline family ABC transporter ATP-binding protein [Spirochaetia bacterium]
MIKLEHVRKIFTDGTEAVKDLSLEIGEGEFCVFLGPSGCGKTTSMKMINRLIPMTSGKIYIQGVDTMKLNVNELRRGIGYAIQNIGLFPHLTVEQNIATVPMLKNWSRAKQRSRAEELLDLVGMDPGIFIDRYPSELSGGQQQRIGVARSLGADPPILLMDEPFGAIDPITRVNLQDEFLKIQAKIKKTIAFVTHDINEAIKMGDKIVLMKDGELVQYSDPSSLLYTPKNEFVRNFVGADRVLKSLRLHKAKDVMQKPPLLVQIGEAPSRIKERMEKNMLKWAMLVDENEHFLGWITPDDLKESKRIKDIIKPPTVTATLGTPLNEALSMMFNSVIGTLAVLDDKKRLAGVLSFQHMRDVLGQYMDDSKTDTGGIQG